MLIPFLKFDVFLELSRELEIEKTKIRFFLKTDPLTCF